MISAGTIRVDAPRSLKSRPVLTEGRRGRQFFAALATKRAQERYQFSDERFKSHDVKEALKDLGLQRIGLVDERKRHAQDVNASMHRIKLLALEYEDTGSARVERLMCEERSPVKTSLLPQHPYSEMARQLITPLLEELAA